MFCLAHALHNLRQALRVQRSAVYLPICGPAGTLDIRYDFEALGDAVTPEQISAQTEYSMWRYRPLLPVVDPAFIRAAGGLDAPGSCAPAGRDAGHSPVVVKDDGRNPTASLKDRPVRWSSHGPCKSRANHHDGSTGNAAAALAGLCASANKKR